MIADGKYKILGSTLPTSNDDSSGIDLFDPVAIATASANWIATQLIGLCLELGDKDSKVKFNCIVYGI